MNVQIVPLFEAYMQHQPQILGLYNNVYAPNLGYEPKRVLNLLNSFDTNSFAKVKVFMLWHEEKLIALIPFEPAQINKILPFKVYKNWMEDMNLFGEPLIDAAHIEDAQQHFSNWLNVNNITFICNHIGTEDAPYLLPLAQTTHQAIWQFERGCIQTNLASEDYYLETTSSSRRRALRKNRKQLDKKGNVEFIILDSLKNTPSDERITQWVDNFLAIENSGWKGQKGTSLATDPRIKSYFADSIKTWFADQQIMAFELKLDNEIIASFYVQVQKTDKGFIGYAIRTAYLEQYISMAPGFLIAQYLYAYIMDEYKFHRIDSCALPNNQVALALMGQRFPYSSFAIAPNAGSTLALTVWLEQKRINTREAIKTYIAKRKSSKATK